MRLLRSVYYNALFILQAIPQIAAYRRDQLRAKRRK